MVARKNAHQVFAELDTNGDGKISRDEYMKALQIMDIPKAIAEVVTESVFSRFDDNHDNVIDKEEFVKYFSSAVTTSLHERIDRSAFEHTYSFVWSLYFCAVGLKLVIMHKEVAADTYPFFRDNIHSKEHLAAAHLMAIIGCSWLTSGLSTLFQKNFGFSTASTLATLSGFWFVLTLYENFVGSITGSEGFASPPPIAFFLSLSLFLFGVFASMTGRIKAKED